MLVLIGDRLVKNSRVGRAWEATREDEDAAELMGVPTFKYKLMAFALGAAIGGLSGSLFASGQGGYINPQSFPLLLSMLFVAAVIVGGAGQPVGRHHRWRPRGLPARALPRSSPTTACWSSASR